MPKPLLAPGLSSLTGIAHGFFTRHGGVSAGIYASLNCGIGSKDEPAAIRENRGRVTSHLGASNLASAYQVHGTTALVVSEPWPVGERPKADAMVTATPGIALGVLTADCAPVLFADAQARVVAAAHAGWRGALSGVVEAAIEAMEGLGAKRERILAAVGPCIGQGAYEVGPEFRGRVSRSRQRQRPLLHPLTSGTGGRTSICLATSCTGCGERAWRMPLPSTCVPMLAMRTSSAIVGRAPGRSPTMAAKYPPSS